MCGFVVRIARIGILALTLLLLPLVVKADEPCDCIGSETTYRLNLCIGGVNCSYDVTMCHQRFVPASSTAPCTDAQHGADAYTYIKRICRNESTCSTLVVDPEVLLKAIMCKLNPIGDDFFNMKTAIPDCGSNRWFSWVVASPMCTRYLPGGSVNPQCWVMQRPMLS